MKENLWPHALGPGINCYRRMGDSRYQRCSCEPRESNILELERFFEDLTFFLFYKENNHKIKYLPKITGIVNS